ncbi:mitogen-activated protein kinase kinase kinase 1 [Juglans microcarpa x Juglans regia]|uniref:mitogen-activated protein kinase kinase kinase 1 n=1 Tax=Juglans microcarpa x Juglans regia TaxID=2249226 RepID=UPI001B7DD162|nr:mitogen-activated protein kinase kinase kinase 1 [Juglans microcarpa x Juglans regia]
MESVASNTPSSSDNHHPPLRFRPIHQPIADRIVRALSHHLSLLHRKDSNFFVLGATGNVYTVTLSVTPSCSCPDHTTPCKHILFVFIRVLGVSLDDTCFQRRTLRPCQLNRLLSTPTSPEVIAGAKVRERFHELFFKARQNASQSIVDIKDNTNCPVCLSEMGKGHERVVICATCQNPIHEECLLKWKRSRGRRSASCVLCRARWRDGAEQEKYLNLAAYVGEDNPTVEDGGILCSS